MIRKQKQKKKEVEEEKEKKEEEGKEEKGKDNDNNYEDFQLKWQIRNIFTSTLSCNNGIKDITPEEK